jgi:hypothetical protein
MQFIKRISTAVDDLDSIDTRWPAGAP